MGSITILLGRSRWRRRRALPEQALSGVDRLGRPDFLYLAASAAKRRAVEREFLSFRQERPVFAPTVRVFDELVDDLWERHGDGRALLAPSAATFLAWDLLADGAGRWPWLARSGPPAEVARALVDYRDVLEGAGRLASPPTEVPNGGEIMDAVRALDERMRRLPGHVPRTTAQRLLIDVVQAPRPAVARQLRQSRTVILDDLLEPSPVVCALLVSLCRAWAAVGTHVVIGLETGRDLGGREVGAFFEYDDIDEVAYALRPFQATRALRRFLFDELVASGEAELSLALRDRVVPIEPGAPLASPEPPDLSDHLYGPRPIQLGARPVQTLLRDTVRVLRHDTSHDELVSVVSAVKARLRAGTAPESCVVAVPGLAGRCDAIRATFEDHGVPVHPTRRGPLAIHPVAILTRIAATVALHGYPTAQVLTLLASDLVDTPDDIALGTLARKVRAAGIEQGLPSTWLGPLRAWAGRQVGSAARLGSDLESELAALDQLVQPLAALNRPMTPEVWRESVLGQLQRLGVDRRAATGPLAASALDAWGGIVDLLDQLVRDQQIAGVRDVEATVLAERLERALDTAPRPRGSRRGGEVALMDVDDLLGLTPRHLWVLGLTREAWPRSQPRTFLVPERTLAELGAARPARAARYLLNSLLRNALDDREIQDLVLSWHASDGGRATAPSPLLEDLLALPTDRTDEHGRTLLLQDLVDLTPPPALPSGQRASLARAAHDPAWRALTDPDHHPTLASQAQVVRARSAAIPGPWEGVLERAPSTPPDRLAVTRLETFLRCPARYWYDQTLGLGPGDPAEPDLPAHRKGSALHSILEAFLSPRLGQPLQGDPDALAAELHGTATRVLEELSARGGAEPALLAHLRDEWMAGLIDDAPHGVLRSWLESELQRASRQTPMAVESKHQLDLGEVTLTASLDRVDHTASGALVLDYKSGRAPSARMVARGLTLQPVAYAAIQAERQPDRPVAAAYLSLREADRIRPSGYVGDPRVLDDVRAHKRGRLDLTSPEREALLDHARSAAHRLRAGVAHITLATPTQAGCRHCPFTRVCRLDTSRAAELAASQADLQRPLDPDGDDDDDDDDDTGEAA